MSRIMSAAVTRTGANRWSIKFLKRTKRDKLIIWNGVKNTLFYTIKGNEISCGFSPDEEIEQLRELLFISSCQSVLQSSPSIQFLNDSNRDLWLPVSYPRLQYQRQWLEGHQNTRKDCPCLKYLYHHTCRAVSKALDTLNFLSCLS